MSTVRRIYFYALALISLEVIIWGVVNLLRTVVAGRLLGSGSLLATGLSLVLVGIPIFFLHWRAVQRDARRDPEERGSRVRAVFLYAVLAATLLPMVYALLAALHRELTVLLGGQADMAWFGGKGSLTDNLVAIVVNGAVFAYFWTVLRGDWRADMAEHYLVDTRRLYRYLWMLCGLTLTAIGVYNLLQFLFALPGQGILLTAVTVSGAISLLVVGVPLWLYHWNSIQSSLVSTEERRSLLRLVVLYLISLTGVIGLMASGGRVLGALIRWIAGDAGTVGSLLRQNSEELAAAIVLGALWGYYGRVLRKEVAAMADRSRRESVSRLYDYILAFLGLAVAYAGLFTLVEYLGRILFEIGDASILRSTLSSGLSALLVGLPVWIIPWRNLQAEAGWGAAPGTPNAAGDRARRSVARKAYLYLVIFLFIVAAMVFAGRAIYLLFDALLAQPDPDLWYQVFTMALALLVTAGLLAYHLRILRGDGQTAQQVIGSLHAAYPTLIVIEESSAPNAAAEREFTEQLVQALTRIAPRLPVAVHSMERGAPDDAMLEARAVMLPAALVIEPPETLRLWLNEFRGQRILVPFSREEWFWLGQPKKQPDELAREAARSLRQIAEGGSLRPTLPDNPWVLAGYILGAIFGLILLAVVFTILFSSLIA